MCTVFYQIVWLRRRMTRSNTSNTLIRLNYSRVWRGKKIPASDGSEHVSVIVLSAHLSIYLSFCISCVPVMTLSHNVWMCLFYGVLPPCLRVLLFTLFFVVSRVWVSGPAGDWSGGWWSWLFAFTFFLAPNTTVPTSLYLPFKACE